MEWLSSTSRFTKWKCVLFLLLPIIPGSPTKYEIEPSKENSGLFNEKLESIRLAQSYWRIVIFLDIGNFIQHFHTKDILRDINHNYEICMERSIREDCCDEVKLNTLTTKLSRIKDVNENLY